ncbi:hypothetical protein HYW17_05390 [Candidatus Uhrbacteria bacterium]|nr:hypothetical protein [Candidatus Uhrbacteria bacterium]
MPTCYGTQEKPHDGQEMGTGEDCDEERPLPGGELTPEPGQCSCELCRNVEVIRTYVCKRCGRSEEVDVTPPDD